MNFAIVLICTAVATALLKEPLRRWPVVFYGLAIVANVLYVCCVFGFFPEPLRRFMFLLMQKCTVSLALFAIVMFIGVFRKDSRVSLALRPVRAELSIVACLLALGHMAVYLAAFLPRLAGDSGGASFWLFFGTALVLLLLLLVLGITSFSWVKSRMNSATWKKVQKWAYVFFGLVYVHLVSILLPSALHGGTAAQLSIAIYTVLFGAYAVLRIRRALIDRKEGDQS